MKTIHIICTKKDQALGLDLLDFLRGSKFSDLLEDAYITSLPDIVARPLEETYSISVFHPIEDDISVVLISNEFITQFNAPNQRYADYFTSIEELKPDVVSFLVKNSNADLLPITGFQYPYDEFTPSGDMDNIDELFSAFEKLVRDVVKEKTSLL